MTILKAKDFDAYWNSLHGGRPLPRGDAAAAGPAHLASSPAAAAPVAASPSPEALSPSAATATDTAVLAIIEAVRSGGDRALRDLAARFDRSSPERLEVPMTAARRALEELEATDASLATALRLAADHIRVFAELQKKQFTDFEVKLEPGLFTGQRCIPVERAAVYVPAGRFPLISTVLMGVIPAKVAGVDELIILSPPLEDGLPDRRILAAAALAGADRIFAVGGAQAVAAAAFGTESVPRCDVIVGPGNKYVAAAKRLLFGQVGIDFVAGPTDVLIIADGTASADLIAADMLAQAEHDPDARARVLVPSEALAQAVQADLVRRLSKLGTADTARASLDAGGLIIIYETLDEAIQIANTIAPEHLELHLAEPETIAGRLRNYGSLFIGHLAAEVLGDYSAGINHTLPTSGTARFTGGLSVRHFIKTVTSLRCTPGSGFETSRKAAAIIARAEGLDGHRQSAESRG
ncbi:histidinol dehydrogenase [Gracilinema caldarium]|uniref:Histidinol dehydrogenase n=1 Tax=Gracilinema caldarium (strain ATCC 51460 / DSM 7334 / H1) TaxID=744872 RepID=F8F4A0_GRAC1|nr:histidinol dehydrogenase [Gracilinema caldarium]AEJ20547.1 Histidinol dehydrogenase [Gracilinema caldarium DSM 7334]